LANELLNRFDFLGNLWLANFVKFRIFQQQFWVDNLLNFDLAKILLQEKMGKIMSNFEKINPKNEQKNDLKIDGKKEVKKNISIEKIVQKIAEIFPEAPNFKSLICLDGKFPLPEFFLPENPENSLILPIIAVDGAANSLQKYGVIPKIIIGDLDSINSAVLNGFKGVSEVVLLPDQNSSDFEKTMAYLSEISHLPAIITGMNGGCLDHVLNNLAILADFNSFFYAENQIVFFVREFAELNLPILSKISIFGAPEAEVTSVGLKWELLNYGLNFFDKNSCFNRTICQKVKLHVISGAILVIIYLDFVEDFGSQEAKI